MVSHTGCKKAAPWAACQPVPQTTRPVTIEAVFFCEGATEIAGPSCHEGWLANRSREAAKVGGAKRDRTADLLHAMQALSQLSYGPISGGACWEARRLFSLI